MSYSKTERLVEKLVAHDIENMGYELVDIVYEKEGQHWFLRIFIDKDGGIAIEDCERVSRKVETILEEDDPIATAYILEISSPGLDRTLKRDRDYVKYKGRKVEVRLYKSVDGIKQFTGELLGLDGEKVSITDDEGITHSFTKKEIALVKLVFEI